MKARATDAAEGLHAPTLHRLLAEAVQCARFGARDGHSSEWITQWRNTVGWLARHLPGDETVLAMCPACLQTGWKFRDETAARGRIALCGCPVGRATREHLADVLAEDEPARPPGDQQVLATEVEVVARLAAEARVHGASASQAGVGHWETVRAWLLDKLPDDDLAHGVERRAAIRDLTTRLAGDERLGGDERMARALAAAMVYRADQLGALATLDERTEDGWLRPWREALEAAVSDRLNELGRAAGLGALRWDLCLPANPAHLKVLGYVSEAVYGGPAAYELERAWARLLGLDERAEDDGPPSWRGMVDDVLDVTLWRVGGPEPFADQVPEYTPPQG